LNPVSEILCILNKNRILDNVQKHNTIILLIYQRHKLSDLINKKTFPADIFRTALYNIGNYRVTPSLNIIRPHLTVHYLQVIEISVLNLNLNEQ
jgi:hypothetical protein